MLTSIVGTNWGDEGKGRMVDLLSKNYDIVVRYQGGNNAGHTVINEKGKFIMNLMPSGILRDETVNVLGPGIVIDLEHLFGEAMKLREAGIEISPDHLKISDRATICMPYHKLLDGLEEDRLGDKKFGSTRRGISPVYADKYMKKTIRMGDLLHWDTLRDRLEGIVEWKNLTVEKGYGHEAIKVEDMMMWLEEYGKFFTPYICNTTEYLSDAIKSGKSVIFEAQLGALTKEKLDMLREADFIFREEIAKAGLERELSQYFAALTNMRSVGVMGDGRTYDYAIALRAVSTSDFMTADWVRLPYDVLDRVSVRIVNEVAGINRVLYDVTSKPPATIEFE